MNNRMYIFNPENDMALANNTIYYKAPKEILRMADDLSVLPMWFAESGASVRVADYYLNVSLKKEYEKKGVEIRTSLDDSFEDTEYVPWGWNPSLIHGLKERGVSSSYLPSDRTMERIRCFSGRQICVDVLSGLNGLPFLCGKAEECSSIEDVEACVRHNGRSILKSPWSGSGRGLMKLESDSLDKNIIGWVSRIIRTQGSVMVEPLYDKVADFAMEFRSDIGAVEFCGYSMFETDIQGNYKCNVLASNSFLEQKLYNWVGKGWLDEIRDRLVHIFTEILPGTFRGYFGVDMMVCLENGQYRIHPCVEVNLRMNMGVVARIISDRYVCHNVQGKYVVEHFFADGDARRFHDDMMSRYPQTISEGRFLSGYFPLTPVQDNTRFHIYLLVGQCS